MNHGRPPKVLSNYVKLKPTDIKDLKERYDISLKNSFCKLKETRPKTRNKKARNRKKADILERIEKQLK